MTLGCNEKEFRGQLSRNLEGTDQNQATTWRETLTKDHVMKLENLLDKLNRAIDNKEYQAQLRSKKNQDGVNFSSTTGGKNSVRGKGQTGNCLFCGKDGHQAFNYTKFSWEKKKKLNDGMHQLIVSTTSQRSAGVVLQGQAGSSVAGVANSLGPPRMPP